MVIVFVKFSTELEEATLAGRVRDHLDACRTVGGLVDVVIGREAVSGDVCGLYTFADEAALQGFQRSEPAWLLPSALEVSEVRMEVIEPWPAAQPGPRAPTTPADRQQREHVLADSRRAGLRGDHHG